MRSLYVLFLSLALTLYYAKSVIVNDMIQRTIDLTNQLVKIHTEITLSESNNKEIKAYQLVFPANISSHIAYLSASIKKVPCSIKEEEKTQYKVQFPSPAHNGEKLSVTYYLTHALTPFPKEIAQHEEQLLLYNDMHIMMSLYETKQQTTVIKLPSERIESYSQDPKPSTQQKNTIKYGSYENTPANTIGQWIQVHFPTNMQFATLTSVVKEMELSFWGKLSVEETYEMVNTGAKLKNGFSRLDYEISNQRGNSIDQLTAVLPAEADDLYYRDQIGNVTTSRFRKGKPSYLFLRPRFPVFGGWKTQWYMGYTLPISSLLTQKSQIDYTLEVDFAVDVENTVIDQLTVKVILPEGVKNPIVRNLPSNVERNQTKRLTYLDTSFVGRTVLIFKKDNVINKHNTPIQIDFQYESYYLILEPALLTSAFFVLYLIAIIFSRIDFKLKVSNQTEQKSKKN